MSKTVAIACSRAQLRVIRDTKCETTLTDLQYTGERLLSPHMKNNNQNKDQQPQYAVPMLLAPKNSLENEKWHCWQKRMVEGSCVGS